MAKVKPPLIVTTAQLCEIFNVSNTTIANWANLGMPVYKRGNWIFKDIFGWWQENVMASKAEEQDKDIAAVKLDYWREKARNEKLKADKTDGDLIDKKDVAKQWAARLIEVANGLSSLSMRLPPLLEGKTQSQMRGIIDREQKAIRNNYYRTGRFCAKP